MLTGELARTRCGSPQRSATSAQGVASTTPGEGAAAAMAKAELKLGFGSFGPLGKRSWNLARAQNSDSQNSRASTFPHPPVNQGSSHNLEPGHINHCQRGLRVPRPVGRPSVQLIKTWVAHALHGRSLQVLLGEPLPNWAGRGKLPSCSCNSYAVSYRLPGCGRGSHSTFSHAGLRVTGVATTTVGRGRAV